MRRARAAAFLALGWLATAGPAAAQTAEPFAKSISLIIGLGPGGNYDLWARTLSHHYGKHLPGNPTVVPQYMPGAGSYIAAGHMAKIAPRDGSVISLISRDAVLGPLTGAAGALFDARALSWLGSPTTETNVCPPWCDDHSELSHPDPGTVPIHRGESVRLVP